MARALGCDVRRSPSGFCFGQCVSPTTVPFRFVTISKVCLRDTAAASRIPSAYSGARTVLSGLLFITVVLPTTLPRTVHAPRSSDGVERRGSSSRRKRRLQARHGAPIAPWFSLSLFTDYLLMLASIFCSICYRDRNLHLHSLHMLPTLSPFKVQAVFASRYCVECSSLVDIVLFCRRPS
jgi:hypothetical protein